MWVVATSAGEIAIEAVGAWLAWIGLWISAIAALKLFIKWSPDEYRQHREAAEGTAFLTGAFVALAVVMIEALT
jgi:hypothetical protein